MINKRLLIKSLLAHNDENSFYDKKRKLNIDEKEGKAKFLKHICALSNSNPKNNSFIVIGVEDEDNKIVGVDFFDDSKIQNLINAYLTNPPIVQYENVYFPHLPKGKVVGLVTIRAIHKLTSLRKNIWKYYKGSVFLRDGSISMPKENAIEIEDVNSEIVAEIEKSAQNNIKLTLDSVINFINTEHENLESNYLVFKEQFVVCWAGIKQKNKEKTLYSRVDIELINEQVKLFYSALDQVEITYTEDAFTIIEYVPLGLEDKYKYYPLEKVTITFQPNGMYHLDSKLIFEAPQFDKKILHHIYNINTTILEKLSKKSILNEEENHDLRNLPATYMICYLNGFHDAKDKLDQAKLLLKQYDKGIYERYKATIRILRKIKYS